MALFLRCHPRRKNGKTHEYWSIVENSRSSSGKVLQRQVYYLGELNMAQRAAWESLTQEIEPRPPAHPLFPAMAPSPSSGVVNPAPVPKVQFSKFTLHNPRQWGACWIADRLWNDLHCNQFWAPKLPEGREGTKWLHILQTLVTYRLIDPGSEFLLHREWFARSAMGDLLGQDQSLAAKDNLYRCLDRLLPHKDALFQHLQNRWKDLFAARFEVVLYDLTSTYFESNPPSNPDDKRRFGYSRDKRSDCVQVIIALIITPEGFPLAYEVLPGNTADKATLKLFLKKLRRMYGKANRTWIMDRGIPTEETLAIMRKKRHKIAYLVGTPKGQLSHLESKLVETPWKQARENVNVKLLPKDNETFILVESQDRVAKERSMRRRKLKALLARLKELSAQKNRDRDELLVKIGQEREKAGRAYGLVKIELVKRPGHHAGYGLKYQLDRAKLRGVYRREGRYLLRTNLTDTDPARLWELYLRLVEIEEAFRDLKSDLSIRPIYHSKDTRIDAHIFVAFQAYCLQVCLRNQLKRVAHGLTSRAVLEKFRSMELVDVHLPLDTGGELILTRRTQPNLDQKLLLERLGWPLPEQGPPRISQDGQLEK